MEQMKLTMLEIVANIINNDFNQKEYFGQALFDIITILIDKNEKISKDVFI